MNETKICKKCNIEKNVTNFYKRKKSKDGLREWCKECEKESCKKYKTTKRGFIYRAYQNQIANSKRRGYSLPNYTKEDLYDWATNQNIFHELFEKWTNSNYNKYLSPSFDRHNDTKDYDYKAYSLDELKIVTWKENKNKLDEDRKNGINNKKSRATLQLDENMNIIKEFYSTAEASRQTGLTRTAILRSCKNNRKYGGYYWSYKSCTL